MLSLFTVCLPLETEGDNNKITDLESVIKEILGDEDMQEILKGLFNTESLEGLITFLNELSSEFFTDTVESVTEALKNEQQDGHLGSKSEKMKE